MRGERICRDINITNDLFVESDETFTVGLVPVDGDDTIIVDGGTLNITIQDDDSKQKLYSKA